MIGSSLILNYNTEQKVDKIIMTNWNAQEKKVKFLDFENSK